MNVAKRVKEGGHAVPEDKIISRYYRSLEHISKLGEEVLLRNEGYINSNYKNEFEEAHRSYSRPYWWLELNRKYNEFCSKQDN